MRVFEVVVRALAMHRAFRAALVELNGRSDRELDELGISRSDVPRAAYEEAERRVAAPAGRKPGLAGGKPAALPSAG